MMQPCGGGPGRTAGLLLLAAVLSLAAAVIAGSSGLALAASDEQEITLRFDPADGAIEVEERFLLTGEDVAFDLAPWMTLTQVLVGGKAVDDVSVGDRIRLPGPGASPQQVVLSLSGVVPPLRETDRRGRLQPAATSPEGGYLSGGAGWASFAGREGVPYRLIVEVPAAYRAVATARLLSEELVDEHYRAVFLSEGLEPPTVFFGPYVIEERMKDGLRLRTYFHPGQEKLAEDYLRSSAAYIRRYADLIGEYPFAGFSVVSAPLPVGLGFEGLTYVSRRILPLPFMRGRSLAHEVLHNWWGNGVAVDYARGNWSEGLTTYMADYALAEEDGAQAAREMRLGWLRDLNALPEERDIPVSRFVSKTHDSSQAVGYGKTALVFHMLRQEIGATAFDAGLRSFWTAKRFKVAGWPDLQQAFEQASGRTLGWFFDQWLNRSGLPVIALEGAAWNEVDASFKLTLSLRQTSPHYRLRIPLLVETEGQSERIELAMDSPIQSFEIDLGQRPRAIHIDPGLDLARRLAKGESPPIFRDVTLSGDTVVVVPSADAGVKQMADTLAGRLLQREHRVIPVEAFEPDGRAVLVIGLTKDVEAFRARHQSSLGEELETEGTARGWTAEGPGGTPWLYVSADNPASLEAVLRPLPHYKSRSFVVFDEAKAVRKGLWPVEDSALSHRFD